MTNQEKDRKATNIVLSLKELTQESRDEWRREALELLPNDSEFIELAYKIATE